jgi:hypothetical protein
MQCGASYVKKAEEEAEGELRGHIRKENHRGYYELKFRPLSQVEDDVVLRMLREERLKILGREIDGACTRV